MEGKTVFKVKNRIIAFIERQYDEYKFYVGKPSDATVFSLYRGSFEHCMTMGREYMENYCAPFNAKWTVKQA